MGLVINIFGTISLAHAGTHGTKQINPAGIK
jgi:hypothetical protein